MKRQTKHWLKASVVAMAALTSASYASTPYVDHQYKFTQPDGSQLSIVLNGSSYYADKRTTDGYPIVFDKRKGGYCFAKLSKDGLRFESTGVLVLEKNQSFKHTLSKNVDIPRSSKVTQANLKRSQLLGDALSNKLDQRRSFNQSQSSQLNGQVKGLTLIIQFPDEPGTIPRSDVLRYLNDTNYTDFGNKQSIRGYFTSVSGGRLDYTNTVPQYYTASNNKSYYTNPNVSQGIRARELIREALTWLDNTIGFDFSTLTTDSQGNVLGLNVFYAGAVDNDWAQGLWPHMGGISNPYCTDGVCLNQYQITNMGQSLSIGTFVHESGHLIGDWPDLYDYDGSSEGSVAAFGVMGYGAIIGDTKFKPVPPVGYFRYLAGWEQVIELNPAVDANAPRGTLAHTANSNTLFRWSNPDNANEAFYIESRLQTGQNEHLPDAGLAIWHVDSSGNNSDEWHPYVQMEHADGRRDPENKNNRGDEDDLFDANYLDVFDATTPNNNASQSTNSKWWNGQDSGLSLNYISSPGSIMSFEVNPEQDDEPVQLQNDVVQAIPSTASKQNRVFYIDIPSGAYDLNVALSGSNGDADLYVKAGQIPTRSDNDCLSESSSSNESCRINSVSASRFYITVHAYSAFNAANLVAKLTEVNTGEETYTGNLSTEKANQYQPDGKWFEYGGGIIEAQLQGPSGTDFDLNLQKWSNSQWTTVASSTSPTSQENVQYTASSGYYRFEIHGYSGTGSYTLTVNK